MTIMIVLRSETELRGELHDPSLQHLEWTLPRRSECIVLGEYGIRVQHVVDVRDSLDTPLTESDALRYAEINLGQTVAVHRTRTNERHGGGAVRARGKVAAERRPNRRIARDIAGGDFGTRNALECRAGLETPPGQRNDGQKF